MIAPVHRLRKDEILWLAKNRCAHRHTYLEHYQCYLDDIAKHPVLSPLNERVGFLDIETSHLTGNFGYMFSYAIGIGGHDNMYPSEVLDRATIYGDRKILGRAARPDEIKDLTFDKNLVRDLIRDIVEFDRLVVYWGKDRRFDIPFIRTRAVHYGINFPIFGTLYVSDCYDIVRGKFRLHSNRLENACDTFGIPCKTHKLSPVHWQRAMAGEKASLDYIWAHNLEDVKSLWDLWLLISQYAKTPKTSL